MRYATGWDCVIGCYEPATHLGFCRTRGQPQNPLGAVDQWVGHAHPRKAVELLHVPNGTIGDLKDWIAWGQGGCVAIVAQAQLKQVKRRSTRDATQLVFVAAASRREILALHRHWMDVLAWNLHALQKAVGQLRKVSVFTTGWSHSLVNLEYVHSAPRHGEACQRLEHERRGSPSAEAERIIA